MKDADMPLLDRIEAALDRIVNRQGLMRTPREATDIDVVVLDCGDEIKRLRADLAQRTAALDQMTVHRNAAIEHRDITQQVLNGITVALSQRTADLAKANAERDEARQRCCVALMGTGVWRQPRMDLPGGAWTPQLIAKEIGWDCFAHANTTDVPVQNGGE
jgi:hypothetical protein